MLSATFRKANNFFDFLFVSLVDDTLPKKGISLKRISSKAIKFFSIAD